MSNITNDIFNVLELANCDLCIKTSFHPKLINYRCDVSLNYQYHLTRLNIGIVLEKEGVRPRETFGELPTKMSKEEYEEDEFKDPTDVVLSNNGA